MTGAVGFYSFFPRTVGLGLLLFINVMKMNEDEMVGSVLKHYASIVYLA